MQRSSQPGEPRLVALMKEIEPQLLDDDLHDKITRLAVRADGLQPDANVHSIRRLGPGRSSAAEDTRSAR